jgi:hypothetical protein
MGVVMGVVWGVVMGVVWGVDNFTTLLFSLRETLGF